MANEQEPTIYSVAREAQVSISTVSRVLNSPHLVKQETRDKVLKAIDQLGFVPKAAAQAQAKKQLGRVGVLTPFFTHPSFVQRMRGIASVLASNSYELVIYPVELVDQVYYYLETIPVTRRLDGLITMALTMDDTVAERFVANNFPAVLMEFEHSAFSNVLVDNIRGGRIAAEYLLGKGHTRCAFVGDGGLPEYSIRPSDGRYTGFNQIFIEKGIDLPADHVIFPTPDQVLDKIEQLLNSPNRPTAIFAASDELAMQVLTVARRKELTVPKDLAVIGFDDLDFASHIGLTTISQQLDESGKIAAEFLLKQIQNPEQPKLNITLQLSIIERDTV
ncbi:MAG: LacI family DNA-binding transcriptional regulator [Anaerolineales bacterium]|nr:LacI family DNA-binding transcriptional regulator [Anaerolineales bacterium]